MRLFTTYRNGLKVFRLRKEIKGGGRIIRVFPQTKDYPFRFEDFKSEVSYTMLGGADTGFKDITTKENSRPIDSIEIIYGKAEIHFLDREDDSNMDVKIIKIHHNDPMVVAIPVHKYFYKIKAVESPTIIKIKRNYRRFVINYISF